MPTKPKRGRPPKAKADLATAKLIRLTRREWVALDKATPPKLSLSRKVAALIEQSSPA